MSTKEEELVARIVCPDRFCSSYQLISKNGQVLLDSPSVPIAVCSGKQWHTLANGGLTRNTTGFRPGTCAGYNDTNPTTSISLCFQLTPSNQRVRLGVHSRPHLVDSNYTTVIEFTFSILGGGLEGTSGCSNTNTISSDPDNYNSDLGVVINGWPSFTYPEHVLSWEGSFLQPRNTPSTGPKGGPSLFLLGKTHVVIGSPYYRPYVYEPSSTDYGNNNHSHKTNDYYYSNYNWPLNPKERRRPDPWSAGAGSSHDGRISNLWNPGIPLSIKSLPAGWSSSTILHITATTINNTNTNPPRPSDVGITEALHSWGDIMRSRTTPNNQDVTLRKIGYQTDNGAFYCFCKGNCSDILIQKVQELRQQQIPMGYLSFQGAGASKGRGGSAPWCVETWGVDDGGLGDNYPMPLKDFHKALGSIPLQLYAPYFCNTNSYINNNNNNETSTTFPTRWNGVRSNTSLPGCKNFDFWDVAPKDSRDFYDWFFAKGVAVGMTSFEPDFMNQNRNCVPEFRETVDGLLNWQKGMLDAADHARITMQWCYATPADLLATAHRPEVTNFRVSTDFCYGNSWDIGLSSLLPSALGKAPSKDTLWSTTNNRTVIPGCSPWTPDHEAPALHVALALLSTGPVGISDGVGYTNATLLQQIISVDGTLLKPYRPATLIDSLIRKRCGQTSIAGNDRSTASGEVYITHSEGVRDIFLSRVSAWYIISFKVEQDFALDLFDLYPRMKLSNLKDDGGNDVDEDHNGNPRIILTWRRFDSGVSCLHGLHAVASGCIQRPGKAILIPASDFSNTEMGTDFGHVVTTVYPMCSSGWRVLGELTKLVSLSPARFGEIICYKDGVKMGVVGTKGEIVDISAVDPKGIIQRVQIELTSDTMQRVFFGVNRTVSVY